MKHAIRHLAAAAALLLASAAALAHDGNAQQITQMLKQMFEKPQAPLTVSSVSIEGPFAVAGWIQGGRGGRAFLQQDHGHWYIAVCGGSGLTQPGSLQTLGMGEAAARKLAQSVASAEAALQPSQRRLLDGFEGMVQVGKEQPHAAHDAHVGHGAQAVQQQTGGQ